MKNYTSILLLFCSLFACTKKRDLGARELYLVSPEKFFGYDPILSNDMYSSHEIGKIYENLYEFHPLKRPFELSANLAEGMPEVSADGLTYTFKIKKGVMFHHDEAFPNGKGRELKAQDFIYSYKRLADPKLTAKAWWLLDDKIVGLNEWRKKNSALKETNYDEEIEGIKALDDHTLQIKVLRPAPQLLYSLAMPPTAVVAHEVVKKYGTEFLNHPVGTGPFTLKKYEQSNQVVYLKNPDYREKLYPSEGAPGDKEKGLLEDAGKRIPLVDKIIVNIQIEAQPTWQSFQVGKSDLIILPKDNFGQVVSPEGKVHEDLLKRGIKVFGDAMIDVTYVAFNNELPIFKDKRVRQAISMAYNREEANRLLYNSTAKIAQSIIPPGLGGYDENFKNPNVEFNLPRAKELLKEAGYPKGKGFPELTYQTIAVTASRQIAEHFAKCMSELGIKIKISINTWPELTNKVARHQAQLYAMAWGADYPDAENFLGLLYCPNKAPGSNGANYCNPKFDELFQKARVMQESPERNTLYAEINRLAAEEVPWIFSFHRTRYHLGQPWMKNFKYMEFGAYQFQYLNVDNEIKKARLEK
jgi:oligopeptide transport system substrate-binding protein